jgi:adenylate kinase
MRVAVTGTPGVGKTTACSLVMGIPIVHVSDIVDRAHAIAGYDRKRRSKEVDVDKVKRFLKNITGDLLIEGHLSHLLDVDVAVVLRCSPEVLKRRLNKKGWNRSKVRENVEAEAIDVVLIDALENAPLVCEIDTTNMAPKQVEHAIEKILAGESEKYPVGNVDWSQEVLSWF